MHYGLAYTMKMCDARYHKGRLNHALLISCRQILSKLVDEDLSDKDIQILTYFESYEIDLIVEVYLKEQPWHAIMIECKVDSELKPHQLSQYITSFNNYYDKENWEKHYYLIKAADIVPKYMIDLCRQNNVEYLTMDQLIEGMESDTENDIFDEFWLRDWE